MEELLEAVSRVCLQLLPVLGCLLLAFLLILIKRLYDFMNGLSQTLNKVNGTIDTIDKDLQDLNVPIQTVVKISHTVDLVHDYSSKVVKESIQYIASNLNLLREWISKALHRSPDTQNDASDDHIVEEVKNNE